MPADYASDELLTNWTKPGYNPIMENTQVLMAYIVMACTGMACIGMACIGTAYIGMACTGMAYIGMASIDMAYIVMDEARLQVDHSEHWFASHISHRPSSHPSILVYKKLGYNVIIAYACKAPIVFLGCGGR